MKHLTGCVILTALVAQVLSSCQYYGPAKLWKTDYGRKYYYCEYEGLELLAPASFKTKDCMECRCTKKGGMTCCGFGFYAGPLDTPKEAICKPVADGCEVKWVLKKNGKICRKKHKMLDKKIMKALIKTEKKGDKKG